MHDQLPEAYEIGSIPFLGLTIHLDSRPLIPRVETEWWVDELLASIRAGEGELTSRESAEPLRALDLCAGSGAIGCALLQSLPEAEVYFGEIDPAHEATIRKNIRENNLDASRAHVGIGDLFEPFGDTRFDLIASNPPYVPAGRELPASVADYEPALALRAGEDGLALIRRIAEGIKKHLAPGGRAWVECDSLHAEAACELFAQRGFAAQIKKDQYERPRVIVISFP